MCITIRETEDQCSSMHEAGKPKLVHWDNPGGWGGEGAGRGVQDGEHMYTPVVIHVDGWQKTPQYHSNVIIL